MSTITDAINHIIKDGAVETNKISDGYHTFGELYEHRITLFIALCRIINSPEYYINKEKKGAYSVWRVDGKNGWFCMGLGLIKGCQVTYHLPMSKWEECHFAAELEVIPLYDGHTSADVLERLKSL